jgi:hypothetical protein
MTTEYDDAREAATDEDLLAEQRARVERQRALTDWLDR